MGEFPLARILDFVRSVVPFDTLDPEELDGVVQLMEIGYFPRGQVVIQAGGEPATELYVIYSGSVKVTLPMGDEGELLVDVRGEGDVFGSLSLLHGSLATFSVTAQEDLLTFTLPAEPFKQLVTAHPAFQRHFSSTLARNIQAARRAEKDFSGEEHRTGALGDVARQMRNEVENLMSPGVVTCLANASIRQAAQIMARQEVGSILVTGSDGAPLGLVTDTDLRKRVVAAGKDLSRPVQQVMSHPLLTISPKAFAFEAMLEMTRHGVHHLTVVKGGRVEGMISDHDIKVLTGTSPVGLAREIDKVASAAELSRLTGRIRQMLDMLNRLCSSLEYMSALLSEFYDRLTVRLLQMVEVEMEQEGLGPAPADYAWLALGCSGRGEQAPPCLQEHALLYGDRHEGQDEAAVRDWFLTLAGRVSGLLETCGEARREGQAMASQEAWCRSQSAWQEVYTGWIREPAPGDVARAAAFFDFRAVMGEGGFAPALRRSLLQAVEKNRRFLRFLAREATERRPPLGFLRDQVVASGGAYSGVLDLDLDAMRPMVDTVRVLALDLKVEETNTLERLAALTRAGLVNPEMGEDLAEAFKFISELRITSFLEGGGEAERVCDHVEPVTLDRKQRKMLKDSFSVINELQDRVNRRYHRQPAVG